MHSDHTVRQNISKGETNRFSQAERVCILQFCNVLLLFYFEKLFRQHHDHGADFKEPQSSELLNQMQAGFNWKDKI